MPFESFSAAIAEVGLLAVAGALSVTGFVLVSPVTFALATFLVAAFFLGARFLGLAASPPPFVGFSTVSDTGFFVLARVPDAFGAGSAFLTGSTSFVGLVAFEASSFCGAAVFFTGLVATLASVFDLLLPVGFESTGFESTGFERVRRGLAGLASVGFVSTGESVLVTGS